jgi:hypothetical protein
MSFGASIVFHKFAMKRLPDSRLRSAESLRNAARPFIDHSVQGLKTANAVTAHGRVEVVYPSSVAKDRRTLLGSGPRALTQSKPIDTWTPSPADCLHCSEALGKHAVPVAKFKSDGRFWVFGQFCSPSCGLGYLREHNESPQVFSWTLQMFRVAFGINTARIHVSPPRFMLKRFGGPMDKATWDGEDFICTKAAPLATFAMFAEVEAGAKQLPSLNLRNLSRPAERDAMPAKSTPTGREPILLKVLAEDVATKDDAPRSPKRAKAASKKRGPTSLSAFFDESA